MADRIESLLAKSIATAEKSMEGRQVSAESKRAFLACPRQDFVQPFEDLEARFGSVLPSGRTEYLDTIFRNTPLPQYFDGARITSTSSQPSMNLILLELLALEPGDRVLEIGSGTGWLLAMIREIVTARGRVRGSEINQVLANFSERALARHGFDDVIVEQKNLLDDRGTAIGGTFNKIVCTTSMPVIPSELFDALEPGGVLVLPLNVAHRYEELFRLTKTTSTELTSDFCMPVGFVEYTGRYPRQSLFDAQLFLTEAGLHEDPTLRQRNWFEFADEPSFEYRTVGLRGYLRKTSWRFVEFARGESSFGFGLLDRNIRSAVLIDPAHLRAFGSSACLDEFRRLCRTWADALLPAPHVFRLTARDARPSAQQGDTEWQVGDFIHLWAQ